MAGTLRGRPGGIIAVLDLIEDGHGEALEADLITHGMRLDQAGKSLPWRAVFFFARRMLDTPGTALAVSVHGPGARWTVQEQLLTALNNRVTWLAWSKSKDAEKGGKPPKPVYLPGLEPEEEKGKHYGTAAPMADVLEMLGPEAKALYGDLI